MEEIETRTYITKGKTVYTHFKKFKDKSLVEEYWMRNSADVDAAGYIAPSDLAELKKAYNAIPLLPDIRADSTIGLGGKKDRNNLIKLINDFKYSGDHELGGKILFLENSESADIKVSSPIEHIKTDRNPTKSD